MIVHIQRFLAINMSLSDDRKIQREDSKFFSVERAYEFAQKLKDSEKFFVAVALQDQVNQADLDFKVEIA